MQRYLTIYLSALAVVAGWLVGPSSTSLTQLVLGNNGVNAYILLAAVALNASFVGFLLYRGLVVQEMTQFVAYYAPRDAPSTLWEAWRRDLRASVAKRVRWINFFFISAVPLLMSIVLTIGTARLAWTDQTVLARWIESTSAPEKPDLTSTAPAGAPTTPAGAGAPTSGAPPRSAAQLRAPRTDPASEAAGAARRAAQTFAARVFPNLRPMWRWWAAVVVWELLMIGPLLWASIFTAPARWEAVEDGTIPPPSWGVRAQKKALWRRIWRW